MRHALWIAAIWVLLANFATAGAPQADDVRVSLSSALVKLGEPVAILVRVEGDVPVRFAAFPEVEGLAFSENIRSSRGKEVRYDSRGRLVTQVSKSFEIRVDPSSVGTYVVPPLRIEVDGAIAAYPDEPMTLEVVADIEASQLLVFERESVPEYVYEGEPYTVELIFGWERSRNLADAALHLPWWDRQDGVIELQTAASQRGAYRFPISPGRREAEVEFLGDRARGGRTFKLFRLRRRFVATRSGAVEFDRSLFRFYESVGRSTGIFSRGETRSLTAPLEPFSLAVRPVPEEGRPIEWSGAVGRIEASREVLRRDVDLGDVLKFEVRWTGDGNLEFFDPPDLSRSDAFRGFRILAVDDEKNAGERRVTYDLVPLDPGIEAIPPVPLPVFDTELGRYVTVETEPVPIRVNVPEGATEDPFGPAADELADAPPTMRDIVARPASGGAAGLTASGPGAAAGALALLFAFFGWVGLRRAVRRRGDPASVEERRRRSALARLSSEVRGTDDPARLSRALESFLASRTGEADEAWIGRGQLRESAGSEVSDALARDYAQLRADLDRAVFGDERIAGLDGTRVVAFARAAVKEGLR